MWFYLVGLVWFGVAVDLLFVSGVFWGWVVWFSLLFQVVWVSGLI